MAENLQGHCFTLPLFLCGRNKFLFSFSWQAPATFQRLYPGQMPVTCNQHFEL